MKTRKRNDGAIAVLCCTLLAFSVNAMGNNSLSFYVMPLSESFGISRASINFYLFTAGLLTRTVFGLFFGKLAARFGIKPLMSVGLAFVLAGFAAYFLADSIVMVGVGSALYGIGHATGTFSSYNVIINRWFSEKKGLMLGILNTAVGLGGMVINPLVGGWIGRYGWNTSFLFTALLIAVIAIPALIFLKDGPPKARGPVPQPERAKVDPRRVKTLRSLLKDQRFWLLAGAQLLIGASAGPAFSNAIPAIMSAGINNAFVNKLSIVLAFGIIVGHIVSGLLFDRFGFRALLNTATFVVGGGMICIGLLTSASPVVLLLITMVCIGYSNTLILSTLSHMLNSVYATEIIDFSSLFGCLFAVQNIGVMIGSPVSGALFDATGSYRSAYLLSAVLLVFMLAFTYAALALSKRRERAITGER